MVIYQEGLFTSLAERSYYINSILKDKKILSFRKLSTCNKQILRKRNAEVLEEMLRGLSETMPEFSQEYSLIKNPSDSSLTCGSTIKDAIQLARIFRNTPEALRNELSFRTIGSKEALNLCIKEYFSFIEKQQESNDPEKLFQALTEDRQYWQEIVEQVQHFVDQFIKEAPTGIPGFPDPYYKGLVPDPIIRLIAQAGKIPIPIERIKRFNLNLLDRIVYPYPEYGFATNIDSWSLFRHAYMDQKPMHFGLLRRNQEQYSLYIINHRDTNALEIARKLNGNEPEAKSSESLENLLAHFQGSTQEFDVSPKINVYRVDENEYKVKRREWLRELLTRFGIVTTIKSLHEDSSLYLTKKTLLQGTELAYQNIDRELVNKHLRKILTLSKILCRYDKEIQETYQSAIPIIRGYQKQVFEMNLGVLVSDISQIQDTRGWLFIPTYLAQSTYPTIGISQPSFPSDKSHGKPLEIAIAIRTTNERSQQLVEQTIYKTFNERKKIF